jgi:site-specific DNA-methyltransferase (adenine-specific)
MNLEVHFSSAQDTWRTPQWLCNEVSQFYRGNFLDPAAPVDNATYTGASRFYTHEQNGLVYPWSGNVYLNPGYGKYIQKWTDKFIEEYASGNMEQGLLLVPARTDTRWWRHLILQRPLLLFFYGRLVFEGAETSAPFPSALVYLGKEGNRLTTHFYHKAWTAKVLNT